MGAGREGEADFGAREPQRSWLWAWHWNPGPTDMTEDPCNVIGKLQYLATLALYKIWIG